MSQANMFITDARPREQEQERPKARRHPFVAFGDTLALAMAGGGVFVGAFGIDIVCALASKPIPMPPQDLMIFRIALMVIGLVLAAVTKVMTMSLAGGAR
jgi:hypothetical protein